MNKLLRYISIFIVAFFICSPVVFAANANCPIFGDPNTPGDFAYYLQIILNVIKYAGIILCIVLTVMEFVKALANDEKDMYKSISTNFIKRLIYAVLLFFLPSFPLLVPF